MSTKVEVLCPNGHRINIKTTPNTKLLQVLEEACAKKGFHPTADYELRHGFGHKVIDLTLTVRYAGLPNNAKLELVKASQSRSEGGEVTVALQTPECRLQENFHCSTLLWDMLLHWDSREDRTNEVKLTQSSKHPVCIYMREEVIGEYALKNTSLKNLGLITGRAIIRLAYRDVDECTLRDIADKINYEKRRQDKLKSSAQVESASTSVSMEVQNIPSEESMEIEELNSQPQEASQPLLNSPNLPAMVDLPCMTIFPPEVHNPQLLPQVIAPELPRETFQAPVVRRNPVPQPDFSDFKFPEETKGKDLYRNEYSDASKEDFKPCNREVVVYNVKKEGAASVSADDDIPHDFFEVTEKDVRMMWEDQQRKIMQEANQPLMTTSMKKAMQEMKLEKYSRAILKIHFPEKVVLQAVFRPRETVFALEKFLKEVLDDPNMPFYLYTTPPKRVLKDKAQTLIEANLVPMSVVYFGSDVSKDFYLSKSLLQNMATERDAVNVIIKHMPSETKITPSPSTSSESTRVPSSSSSSKKDGQVPKWLKLGKK